MPDTGSSGRRPLEVFGISEEEETLYRWLLTHASATLKEISEEQAWPLGKARRVLNIVETKGLVTHTPHRPRRYIPVSPDLALESLADQNRKAVDQALALVPELRQQLQDQSDDDNQVVELITSQAILRQTYELIIRTAKTEVVGLSRMPIHVSRIDKPVEEEQHNQMQSLRRGVSFRTIVDTGLLELPGMLEWIHTEMQAGEKTRVVASLPFKMILVDRRLGLVPLYLERRDSPSLLVRSSSLLDGLYSLFETLWERAAPVFYTPSGVEYDIGDWQMDKESQELISMMVAGFNDKSIAYELGVTTRTLQRRVSKLMSDLNAKTRFQLGWSAASKLSLDSSSEE